jgi:hypothetical protein
MRYTSLLLASASLFSSALAIGFTHVPVNVTAGVSTTITWAGAADSSPVTIILKKGDAHNLQTVAVLTDTASGGSFTWTPDKSLPDGSNYAFFISQGLDETNYSGMFVLTGGSTAAATTIIAAATTSTVAANATTAYIASITGTGITVPRNTTFSIQSLTAGGGLSAGAAPTTTTEISPSSTSSPSATPTKNAAIRAGSPLAFVMSAFAAILFWA